MTKPSSQTHQVTALLDAWSHTRRPHDHSHASVLPSFVAYYTPAMVSIAALTLLLTHSFYRTLIVLMDSCPCALLIAAPVPLAAASLRSPVDIEAQTRRLMSIIHQNLAFTIGIKVLFLIPTMLGGPGAYLAGLLSSRQRATRSEMLASPTHMTVSAPPQ